MSTRAPDYVCSANFRLLRFVLVHGGFGSTSWSTPSATMQALVREKDRIVYEFERMAADDPDCPPDLATLHAALERAWDSTIPGEAARSGTESADRTSEEIVDPGASEAVSRDQTTTELGAVTDRNAEELRHFLDEDE